MDSSSLVQSRSALDSSSPQRLNWKKVVEIAREEARRYYEQHGIALTLRGLFYILVSREVIANTLNNYKMLSSAIARARYFNKFEWHLLRDETRNIEAPNVIRMSDGERILRELEKLSDEELKKYGLEYLKSKYVRAVWKWDNQKYLPIIVVEKQAVFDAVKQIVDSLNWQVFTTTTRGFESATAVYQIATLIDRVLRSGKTPVLLMLYDFDPSGEYAVLDTVFRILMLLVEDSERLYSKWERARTLDEKQRIVDELAKQFNVVYEKVMLTHEQVQKYSLPPVPQFQEAIEKLHRDTRKNMFQGRYGFLGQTELDAMLAIRYEEAVKIIDSAIAKYFDGERYREVERVMEELNEKLREIEEKHSEL